MKRGITLITVAMLVIASGLGALSVSRNVKSTREFVADGYILKPSSEEIVTTDVDEQYYFGQGTKYKEKYATKVLFKDKTGEDVAVDVNQYLHYADGSLGSFTKGVIMNLSDITDEQFGYYSLTKNTILVKNGNSYEMSSRGEAMELSEFIWKISDTDYMIVSPEVTLHLNESSDITLPEYAQIKYVDNGIVRIVYQQGTYQTVSADTFLRTQSGAELNLVGKNFYINGEPALSLDSMSIDDDSYIELDENTDTPELKLPTFNVINGKDGASGSDGESGEDGEEGVIGEDGGEGVAGAEGMQGVEGAAGQDGMEGDTGIMGFDGAEGREGKDAVNAGDASGITPVDLKARPTVSLNTADGYDVTASTANMQLSMNNSDNSLVPGETTVKVYDRATMTEVHNVDANGIANLESGNALSLGVSGLNPDTEYVVVVSGRYAVDASDTVGVVGTLLTKVFKTDALGITIEKFNITENSVSVTTNVTASNVASYDVVFFKEYQSGGTTPDALAVYSQSTSQSELVLSDTEPGDDRRKQTFTMDSNTTYYAQIANVTTTGSQVINTGDTTVELKTLKKKPYKTGEPDIKISAMKPVITQNIKTHSLNVSMDAVTDEDNGVTGYRYELYKQSDISSAIMDSSISDIEPVYIKESPALTNQTFDLTTSDTEQYCAKIVALFNDNEKDVEFSTLFSDAAGFANTGDSLVVEFIDVNKTEYTNGQPDRLSGDIKVTDPDGILLGNVSAHAPIVLTIAGEYDDVYSIELTNPTAENGYSLFHFAKDGLRAGATYTLVASGPCETDGTSGLSAAEKLTYLAGLQGVTPSTQPLSLVSYDINMASVAFAKAVNLTYPATAGTTDSVPASYYAYEAMIMDNIQFELVHITETGERVVGTPVTLVDHNQDTDVSSRETSEFSTAAWIDRNNATVTSKTINGGVGIGDRSYLEVAPANANTGAAANFVLTPQSFGLNNSDSIFFSGGVFEIRVKTATDYTQKNIIPFVDGEDVIAFTVVKKHVQATDPNSQVEAELITNDGAISGEQDPSLEDDTSVGIRFRADYPYSDIVNITYYIYELEDTTPTPSNATTINANNCNGKHVLTGTRVGGSSGGTTSRPIELYFKGTKSYTSSGTDAGITWTKPGNVAPGADEYVLKRGGRYFIRYEVESDCTQIDCDGDFLNDKYPYCAYDTSTEQGDVPFYRSTVIEIEKQLPKIERYPYTSTADIVTWKYRISDPDAAIVRSANDQATFNITRYTNLEDYNTGTGTSGDYNVPAVNTKFNKNEFFDLTFGSMSDGSYYTVSIPYKLKSTDMESNIISSPIPFNAALTAGPTGITCKGPNVTSTTLPENKDGETEFEKALISEGGYRYRLRLQGSDIPKYAALRITVSGTGSDSQQHSVVYDPVYMENIGELSSGGYSADACLDASPLQTLLTAGVTNATVKVEGYYSTNVSGVDGYQSVKEDYKATTNTSFNGENLFALKTIGTDGTTSYKVRNDGGWVNTATGMLNGSVFVPGIVMGSGFSVPVDATTNGELSQRYPAMPLNLADDVLGADSNVTVPLIMDENGMKDTTSSTYYTVEKLGTNEIGFADTSLNINIGEILPAVQVIVPHTSGARSAYVQFNTIGTGASESSKIYAKIYRVNADNSTSLLKVEQKEDDNQHVKYYEVVQNTEGTEAETTTEETGYSYDNFNSCNLPISTSGGNIVADLRIRGLEKDTKYQIVMFAYTTGTENKLINLYSMDGKRTNYPYEFKTLKEVQINVNSAQFVYTSYTDKKAVVRFGIPGDEGTGMTMKYQLYESNGTTEITSGAGTVNKLTGDYYSQDPMVNHPIYLSVTPGSGLIALGNSYILKVYAVDSDNVELGATTITINAPTEGALKNPTFMVQPTKTASGINININSSDENHIILNDSYQVDLFEEGSSTAIRKWDVKRNTAGAMVHSTNLKTEANDNIEDGKTYKIKITAKVDKDNNNIEDESPITSEYVVVASATASATLGGSATTEKLSLQFSNLQNFGAVKNILITAFKDGSQVYSVNTLVSEDDLTAGSFSKELDWGTQANGTYTVQIQYRDYSSQALGNGEITVNVTGTRALTALFSMRSSANELNAIPSVTPTATDTKTETTTGTTTGTTPVSGATDGASTTSTTTTDTTTSGPADSNAAESGN